MFFPSPGSSRGGGVNSVHHWTACHMTNLVAINCQAWFSSPEHNSSLETADENNFALHSVTHWQRQKTRRNNDLDRLFRFFRQSFLFHHHAAVFFRGKTVERGATKQAKSGTHDTECRQKSPFSSALRSSTEFGDCRCDKSFAVSRWKSEIQLDDVQNCWRKLSSHHLAARCFSFSTLDLVYCTSSSWQPRDVLKPERLSYHFRVGKRRATNKRQSRRSSSLTH